MNSRDTAKFYLYRFDPAATDLTTNNEPLAVGSAQVVMPLGAALEAVAFLMSAIDKVSATDSDLAARWEQAKASAKVHGAVK